MRAAARSNAPLPLQVWSPAGSCTGTLLPPAAAAAPAGPRGGGFLAAVAGGPGAAAAPALDGPSHGSAVTCLVEMCLGGQTFLMSGAIDGSIKVREEPLERGAFALVQQTFCCAPSRLGC